MKRFIRRYWVRFWNWFALQKVYYDRSSIYKSYVKSIFGFLTFIGVYRDSNIGKLFFSNVILSMVIVIVATVIVSMLIGKFDKKHIRPRELKEITSTNPHIMEMKEDIKTILKRLDSE